MRLLIAFAWLRWRLIANSLRAAERRDTLERISRVTELLAPGLLLATSLTSIVLAIGFGAMGGWLSVSHVLQGVSVLPLIRVILLLATIFTAFVPLFVGAHGGMARFTRLLLLPIPRRQLHLAEVVTGLADPWVVFVLPGLVAYAGGMIAGALTHSELKVFAFAGVIALVAALGVAFVLASLGAFVAFLVSWIVRDRRRSELFVVLLVIALSLVSAVPALVSDWLEQPAPGPAASRTRTIDLPARSTGWSWVLPSELYGEAVSNATESIPPWPPLLALFLEGAVFYVLSGAVHGRLLESAQGGRARRGRSLPAAVTSPRIPGLWPGTSAVAVAQARTALRSVRGRLVVLLPGPLVAMFALALRRVSAVGAFETTFATNGPLLLGCGIVFGLYAAQPFTMNQFGSDRAGLTLQFLAPIRDVDLIRGKAIGCGAIVAAGVFLTLGCVLLTSAGGPLARWIATIEGGVALYLLVTPLAAWFSVLFPVAADLSKMGGGGNPHTLAMLGGMIFVAAAAEPEALILMLLSPVVALVTMTCWTAALSVISNMLLGVAARALRARRENLALVAQGR